MSLLNPGTLTEYEGPRSSSRRSRGTVRVRDPARGFFVAGSCLKGLNGIYARVRTDHFRFLTSTKKTSSMRLCYRHDESGWLMALMDVDPDDAEDSDEEEDEEDWRYGYEERRCTTQWRFIDDSGVERFKHKGDTVIPGAGVRWKHLRGKAEEGPSAAAAAAEVDSSSSTDDDEEEEEEDDDSSDGDDEEEAPTTVLEDVRLDDDDHDHDKDERGSSSAKREEDDRMVETSANNNQRDPDDELPWQVIALLDASVLEDLRFSSKCRDERVNRALEGNDVDRPPESTIGGFLEAEQQRRNRAGAAGKGDEDDEEDVARGWIYRVVADGGVSIYDRPFPSTPPDGEGDGAADRPRPPPPRRVVGRRSLSDYVRVVERLRLPLSRAGTTTTTTTLWLRLASSERPVIPPPLSVGDPVRVVSGHYKGERGTIREPMDDDTREFGVTLKGYTGVGYVHVTALERDGTLRDALEARRAARREARRKAREERRRKRFERRRRKERREQEREIMRKYYGPYEEFWPTRCDSSDDEEEEDDSEGEEEGEDGNDTEDEAMELAGRLFGVAASSDAADDGDNQGEGGPDETYDGPLWVAATSRTPSPPENEAEGGEEDAVLSSGSLAATATLVEVPARDAATLRVGPTEKDGADLYDRPFEPRIEDGTSSGAASEKDEEEEEDDDMDDAEGTEGADDGDGDPPAATLSCPLLDSTRAEEDARPPTRPASVLRVDAAAAAVSAAEGDDGVLPVGSAVVLVGLKGAAAYNGRSGTVVAGRNADGRLGVRLDPRPSSSKSSSAATTTPDDSDDVTGDRDDVAGDRDDVAASDDDGERKLLLVKPENVSARTLGADGEKETSSPDGGGGAPPPPSLDRIERRRIERAARVLDVRPDAVGLPGNEGPKGDDDGGGGDDAAATSRDDDEVDADAAREILDALLRAAERVYGASSAGPSGRVRGDNASSSTARMRSDALESARDAHAVLVSAVRRRRQRRASSSASDDNDDDDDADRKAGSSSAATMLLRDAAPHRAVELGYLGVRARNACRDASDGSSFDRIEKGLAALGGLLEDERRRLFRRRDGGGGGEGTLVDVAKWKLDKAERSAAAAADDNSAAAATTSNDCLRLRLTLVRALFESSKFDAASAAAEETMRIYPRSSAALLWRGRTLLRTGRRTDGVTSFVDCVSMGPNGGTGPGGPWAHGEAARRLRSMRRTLRGDVRARDAYERGKFGDAAKVYAEMLEEYDGGASDDQWGRAEALSSRAACHRRNRNLGAALADCDAALDLFPRYPRALFRRALCLLESSRPSDAVIAFERLLRVDWKWPDLLDWLVRATATARRLEANGGGRRSSSSAADGDSGPDDGNNGGDPSSSSPTGNEDYYAVLGVSSDATESQLKRAYRLTSLKVHPDKRGGSSAAFQLVATAYETLSDPEKRRMYDDGVDDDKTKKKKRKKGPYDEEESSSSEDEDGNKKRSLREEVERKYFPQNYEFWPFGDPFVNKRRHVARKKKREEEERRRKERFANGGWNGRRHPWGYPGDDAWDL